MRSDRPPSSLLADAHINQFVRHQVTDGWLLSSNSFFSASEATSLEQQLLAETPWQQHQVKLFGKTVDSPRLSSWHGAPESHYRYSGFSHQPHPFTPAMQTVLNAIHLKLRLRFNSVLANLYRNGQDSMGLHADDERELGDCPLIASVSLGARRRIIFRHRHVKGQRFEIELEHGSLMLMGGVLQSFWRHEVPKDKAVSAPRINLTFRNIVALLKRPP